MRSQGTIHCKVWEFKRQLDKREVKFALIDTPGLEDTSSGNLRVLQEITSQLGNLQGRVVSGAIYFHRITDKRMTGTGRANFDIFKAICGEAFFPRTVIATTMWNHIQPQKVPAYRELQKELQTTHMHLPGGGDAVFELPGNEEAILRHFVRLKALSRPQLLLEVEANQTGRRGVRKTRAGKEILKKSNDGFCAIL